MPVVDASVVVDWIAPDADPEGSSGELLRRLAEADEEILAPRLLMEEAANALLTGMRRGRWDGVAADRAHRLLGQLPVRLVDEPRDLARAWDLSRRHDAHPVYDMLYVALAERRRTMLITADTRLVTVLEGFDWVVGPSDWQP